MGEKEVGIVWSGGVGRGGGCKGVPVVVEGWWRVMEGREEREREREREGGKEKERMKL